MKKLFLTLLCTLTTGGALPAAEKPNVLFILCDDIRWDALGCAGHPHLKTPNIDRLAAEGVRFKNMFCTTSLCSPSRASILSGLYAHSHKVVNNFTEYPTELASFPRQLHDAGYATAYIGKWHMGEDNDEKRPGFDYFVTHKGQGKYFDTEFNLDGKERKVLPGYYTHIVQKLALDWLGQQQRDKPWLLMIGEKAPHSFYFPEKKYEHAFDGVTVRYPESAFQLDDKPAWIKERLYTWHGIYGPLFEWRKKFPDDRPEAVKDFENMTHAYLGTILSVDDSVGQMTAALRERGELENTLIVFMGDNGLLNGEDGMIDKRTMHEASIRIPLIVRYPRAFAHPRVVEQQVLTIDVAPSILELCGAPALPKIQGRSFVNLARGEAGDWRKSWFYEYNYEKQFPYTPNVRGVRTDDWKYIHYPHGDGGPDRHLSELYDLRSDPQELHNLIKDPAQAGRIAELQGELARLLKETGVEKDEMPLDEGIKQALPDQKIR
jgi:N-acetylglucosamine-6-sulfatase